MVIGGELRAPSPAVSVTAARHRRTSEGTSRWGERFAYRSTFTLDRAHENILEAGLANGVELPYSCKGGVCSTCRCRLVEGEVDMDVNFALEDYEVARGFILSCQSYPVTDKVVVDFDQTGTG